MDDILQQLATILDEDQIKIGESMDQHTTFQTGGRADCFLIPREDQLEQVLELCTKQGVPWLIIGNGSNILVSDEGIRGMVVCIGQRMSDVRIEGDRIYAQAGAMLGTVANMARKASLSGMEFAAGIPGTIGGACVMNAGAYGGEMKQIIESLQVLNRDGTVSTMTADEYQGGYRTSAVMRSGCIVLSAVLKLEPGDMDEIQDQMDDLRRRRVEKQPLDYPSAGSTFKRPEGHFAGKLIEDSGLAGYQIGGAKVSEKHCGFIINADHATSSDIHELMGYVIKKVFEDTGITLDPEVKCIGRFVSAVEKTDEEA